jgi:hypothetical protein
VLLLPLEDVPEVGLFLVCSLLGVSVGLDGPLEVFMFMSGEDEPGDKFCPPTWVIKLLPLFAAFWLLAEDLRSLLERCCVVEETVFVGNSGAAF